METEPKALKTGRFARSKPVPNTFPPHKHDRHKNAVRFISTPEVNQNLLPKQGTQMRKMILRCIMMLSKIPTQILTASIAAAVTFILYSTLSPDLLIGIDKKLIDFAQSANQSKTIPTIVIFIVIAGLLVATKMMTSFLTDTQKRSTREQFMVSELFKRVKHLQFSRDLLSKNEKSALSKEIQDNIKSLSIENWITELKSKLEDRSTYDEIEKCKRVTLDRIAQELAALNRRGTVNLVIGTIMALVGIAILSLFAIFSAYTPSNFQDFAINFLPRLSIVVIIEVFSFFYLKLHKATLSEIKYFHNEATNSELKYASLGVAVQVKNSELIHAILQKFVETERNPILNSKQTTRELEIEKGMIKEFISTPYVLETLFKSLKDKKDE